MKVTTAWCLFLIVLGAIVGAVVPWDLYWKLAAAYCIGCLVMYITLNLDDGNG